MHPNGRGASTRRRTIGLYRIKFDVSGNRMFSLSGPARTKRRYDDVRDVNPPSAAIRACIQISAPSISTRCQVHVVAQAAALNLI